MKIAILLIFATSIRNKSISYTLLPLEMSSFAKHDDENDEEDDDDEEEEEEDFAEAGAS